MRLGKSEKIKEWIKKCAKEGIEVSLFLQLSEDLLKIELVRYDGNFTSRMHSYVALELLEYTNCSNESVIINEIIKLKNAITP